MALAIRGDQTSMGYENSDNGAPDPYGTALDLSSYADAKICAQVTPNFTADEVEFDTVGCGGTTGFGTEFDVANREYRVSLEGDLGFQTGFDRILAQFMGDSTAPAEQTLGEGDYLHVLTFADPADQHFGTFAFETSDDDVLELISTFTESVAISMAEVGQAIRWSASLVSNDVECDAAAAVNDNAVLDALTFDDPEIITPECAHKFRIKPLLDDGTDTALADGDNTAIVSFDFEAETPHEIVPEMTGGACNSPTQEGPRAGTLTVTFKEHKSNDVLSFCNWIAEGCYQASISWEGSQIGAGVNHRWTMKFPKLCLVEAPQYNVTDPGLNPYTLVFKILDSVNVIPGHNGNGMSVEIVNSRAGEYLLT